MAERADAGDFQRMTAPGENAATVVAAFCDAAVEQVRLVHQPRYQWADRPVRNGVGRIFLKGAATVQHADPVGQCRRLGQVVGDEDDRDADLPAQHGQLALQLAPGHLIHCGEWFVEEQHFRLAGQGARQGDALSLPAGEGGGPALLESAEMDQLKKFAGARLTSRRRQMTERQRHVIARRQMRE